jgi:hypothetical protein
LENPVKIRPLPEIDLACIAPMAREQKRNALEALNLGFPTYSYAPVRASLSDILNVRAGMIGPLPRPPWARIKDTISKKCRKDTEQDANLRVGEGLFDYVDEEGVTGRHQEIYPLALGVGTKVTYWHQVVLTIDRRPIIPFFDPRRTKALTIAGRRFVFSVMHERIRAADPDYAVVALGVVQFVVNAKGPRQPVLWLDDGVTLFTFDELDEMVRETYDLWREVCEERAAEDRRTGTGGRGDGFPF